MCRSELIKVTFSFGISRDHHAAFGLMYLLYMGFRQICVEAKPQIICSVTLLEVFDLAGILFRVYFAIGKALTFLSTQ